MQSLGADEVVNYREQDFAEVYKDPSKHFDAVIDCLGGKPCFKLLSYHILLAALQQSCVLPAQVMRRSKRTQSSRRAAPLSTSSTRAQILRESRRAKSGQTRGDLPNCIIT